MADTKQLTHMKADLLFVFLFVRTMLLCPLYDIFYFRDLHIVLFQYRENVTVRQALI